MQENQPRKEQDRTAFIFVLAAATPASAAVSLGAVLAAKEVQPAMRSNSDSEEDLPEVVKKVKHTKAKQEKHTEEDLS